MLIVVVIPWRTGQIRQHFNLNMVILLLLLLVPSSLAILLLLLVLLGGLLRWRRWHLYCFIIMVVMVPNLYFGAPLLP